MLPSGNLAVDQFYAGLLLSSILTPAAIAIRKLSVELALLHPFAVAAATPTALQDLDLLMDPGLSAMLRLFKYDKFKRWFKPFSSPLVRFWYR